MKRNTKLGHITPAGANIFADLGFKPEEAAKLLNESNKVISEKLPAYEPDDGPLTEKQVAALRQDIEKHYPRGTLIERTTLFDDDSSKPGS